MKTTQPKVDRKQWLALKDKKQSIIYSINLFM